MCQRPEVLKLSERQYSLQHVKAFGLHNHLILDPWNKNCVFYVDSQWKICLVSIDENSRASEACPVLAVPDSSYKKNVPDRLCMTLEFISAELAILADGAGTLYIIKTGVRTSGSAWEVLHSEVVLGEDKPFLLRSASLSRKETELEIILLHVDTKDDGFISILEWLSFHSDDGTKWAVTQSRRLEGKLSPDHVNVVSDTQSLYLSGEQSFKFVYDSINPVEEEDDKMADGQFLPTLGVKQMRTLSYSLL
ncbi:hypothetical protein CAPTEDRAFT_201699 [Capitella teleta]|uniref:EF-hand domain-containing protein n=1 Tax=Capitella teleta TaxID=283909 RepID=R7UVD4_CAPTE|nr:hypothetical protein CAPTEDRAFT_201699 [Capitella teleta]|eukprot:ELU10197.1 hypothetical protein CAPTEDRAFT_201699 [Capitella teleta]